MHFQWLKHNNAADMQAGSMDELLRERDAAVLTAVRLKQRIGDLFGAEAAQLDALVVHSKNSARGKSTPRCRSGFKWGDGGNEETDGI